MRSVFYENYLWPLLQADSAQETREFIDWGALPPMWAIVLVVVPAVGFFVFSIYRRERAAKESRWWWVPAVLRSLVLLAILTFLAQPMLRRVVYQTRDPHLLVLYDDSLSMDVVDKYSDRAAPSRIGEALGISAEEVESRTRSELVDELLYGETARSIERLRDKMKISIYSFAGSVRKTAVVERDAEEELDVASLRSSSRTDASRGDARVKETRIGDSVLEALGEARDIGLAGRDQGLVGILALTDGQNTGGVVQPEEMAMRLRQRGVPLLAVGVGNPDPPQNIRVTQLDVSDMVLVGDRVPFDGTVVADGFAGERVQVDLLFDGEVVESDFVTLAGGGEKQNVRIEYRPQRKGDFNVSLRVEVLGGELFEEDNEFSRPIKVLEEKIRVLYVEGPPRWEYRYLKNALVRDPTMEAQVLLLSADEGVTQESSPGVPPLLRFPDNEKELFPYHVIILGDVHPTGGESPARRLEPHQLELLQRFVSEAGGGLIFIAGSASNPRDYVGTPLEPLLPVEVPRSDRSVRAMEVFSEPFNVELTAAGAEHPILRLDNDPQANRQLLENEDGIAENHLPGFYWYSPVYKLKLGAIALAHHPRDTHLIHGNAIILALQNYGKGRCLFSAVDGTWRWRSGVDNLYFSRFWGQAIRFVASGRLLGQTPRYSLTTDKLTYALGERINLDAKVFDANMKPLNDPEITVYHAAGSREERAVQTIQLSQNPVKGPGAYDGAIVASQLGGHDFWLGSESERVAFRTVTVEVPPLEFRNPRMDREGLKKVAELSEGKYYDLQEFREVLAYLGSAARPREIPVEESQDDLWDEQWALLLFTGLISAEWIIRKALKLL